VLFRSAAIRADAKRLGFTDPLLADLSELHDGYLKIQLMYTPDELDAMAKRAASEPTKTIEEVRRVTRSSSPIGSSPLSNGSTPWSRRSSSTISTR